MRPAPSRLADVARELLVTAGGLGLAPWAPGTFGTLGGLALAAVAGVSLPGPYAGWLLLLALAASAGCVATGPWAERHYGRKDPPPVVLDEVAGYMVAALWPVFPGWTHLAVAFLAFRITDILKPWPARGLQRLPAGWGIVVDDLVAGAWALLLVVGLRLVFPDWIGT